jgi:hypothetical protein
VGKPAEGRSPAELCVGTDIVPVDIDGRGANNGGTYVGYEMAIEMQNQTGTLTNANFLLIV